MAGCSGLGRCCKLHAKQSARAAQHAALQDADAAALSRCRQARACLLIATCSTALPPPGHTQRNGARLLVDRRRDNAKLLVPVLLPERVVLPNLHRLLLARQRPRPGTRARAHRGRCWQLDLVEAQAEAVVHEGLVREGLLHHWREVKVAVKEAEQRPRRACGHTRMVGTLQGVRADGVARGRAALPHACGGASAACADAAAGCTRARGVSSNAHDLSACTRCVASATALLQTQGHHLCAGAGHAMHKLVSCESRAHVIAPAASVGAPSANSAAPLPFRCVAILLLSARATASATPPGAQRRMGMVPSVTHTLNRPSATCRQRHCSNAHC